MRPVIRGEAPRTYTAYRQALNDLVDRMGRYCSYCERQLPTSLAVEHVVPKSLDPELERDWENFLLGCTNCNSVKLAQPTNKRDFLWPDLDNTCLAFTYSKGGYVEVSSSLTETMQHKASKLMALVGLNRHKDEDYPRPAGGDQRWMQRDEAWRIAEECKERVDRLDANGYGDEARDLTLEVALAKGFFSIWMIVFADDPMMLNRLIKAFTGTAADCFDEAGAVVNRPGGRV